MGNGMRKLSVCFAGDAGEISRRRNDDAVCFAEPLDEGLGHSYCYIPHDFLHKSQYLDECPSAAAAQQTSFRTISGAAISANVSTPLSTDPFSSTTLDKASAFKSSTLFSSIPLQPVPRNSSPMHTVKSGPILRNSDQRSGLIEQGFMSGPIERNFISGPLDDNNNNNLFSPIPLQPVPRYCDPIHTVRSGPILRSSGSGSDPTNGGFLSGPIERSFISGPLDNNNQFDKLHRYGPNSKKRDLVKNLKKVVSKSFWSFYKELNGNNNSEKVHNNVVVVSGSNSGNSSTTITSHTHNLSSENELSLVDDNDDVGTESFFPSPNLQWAQGKAGEDRVHIVISEEQGWVFVGIYDGFNGPDATEFLLNNLYTNVHKELKGLLWFDKSCENMVKDSSPSDSVEVNPTVINHLEVLKRLSEALRKTEESYLEVADMMLIENPELALMGSCVLVMVMKGDDVYLMNVGDSRAVLAQKVDNDLPFGKMRNDYVESYNCYYDYANELSNSSCCQLTLDHCTSIKEEVRRVRNAHKDDAFAVMNGRVKGSLKVTRAFGAGFLKQPKWNNALLEMFRIDYIGTSPYITCLPSLCHRTLESKDKFLILSSDGLYQYFTNEEAVYEVEIFMSTFPEGDPAQHLVKELLFRAAKKAGMDFHQLLDIPQGDRRRYHDDVSIIIISFEGSMWRSSV